MNADIARPDLASCRTRLIGAKLVRRVHWLCCAFHHSQHANGRFLFQALMTFSPVSGELPDSVLISLYYKLSEFFLWQDYLHSTLIKFIYMY